MGEKARESWIRLIRRSGLAIGLLVAAITWSPRTGVALTAERVASGLSQPLFVTSAPGDATHIYIVEQVGRIRRLDLQTGQLTTFFTISGLTSTSGEQGLLGLAFDPNYA